MTLCDGTINSKRRTALRKDAKYIHIMKYMGSKRELLPDIREEIEKMINPGEGVLDIFAGTGSVGLYLKDKFDVVSNDIQNYSAVICDALITSSSRELSYDSDLLVEKIKHHFLKNKKSLEDLFPKTLKKSRKFVSIEKRKWTEEQRLDYIKFVESYPSPINDFQGKSAEQKKLHKMFLERGENAQKKPYLQTCFLFPETYFSFEQCADIDSLRYAIDMVFDSSVEKNLILTALIYAHSYCSSGTGHFAMFRDLKDVNSINDTFLYRPRNVFEYFEKKLKEICIFHTYNPSRQHKSVSMNYVDLLKEKKILKNVKVIYADPPYSFVHYSRFYHATESLVKYDYMIPKHKGRYRTDRHQSPFCQSLNVYDAFENLFSNAALNGKHVLLSYSDTAMIALDKILEIITNCGMTYSVREVNYDHSTLGREGHKSNQIKEYLISALVSPLN